MCGYVPCPAYSCGLEGRGFRAACQTHLKCRWEPRTFPATWFQINIISYFFSDSMVIRKFLKAFQLSMEERIHWPLMFYNRATKLINWHFWNSKSGRKITSLRTWLPRCLDSCVISRHHLFPYFSTIDFHFPKLLRSLFPLLSSKAEALKSPVPQLSLLWNNQRCSPAVRASRVCFKAWRYSGGRSHIININ